MEIRGSTAVVTGGGSGLGEATAREIVARGGRALILDRDRSRGAEVAKSLGAAALFAAADVTDEAGVAAALERAVAELGALRAVVSCAGIGTPGRVVDKTGKPLDLDVFRRVIEVNLIGTFACHILENPMLNGEVIRLDGALRMAPR